MHGKVVVALYKKSKETYPDGTAAVDRIPMNDLLML